jgi:hypothetical protein
MVNIEHVFTLTDPRMISQSFPFNHKLLEFIPTMTRVCKGVEHLQLRCLGSGSVRAPQ